jgi:hypothetical protein
MKITEDVSLVDLDETLSHLSKELQDRYGNRVDWKRKELLIDSIDDLLDYRLLLTKEGETNGDFNGTD